MRGVLLIFLFLLTIILSPNISLGTAECQSQKAKVLLEEAVILEKRGDIQSAELNFFEAIKVCNDSWVWIELARFYDSTMQYEKVIKVTNNKIRENFPQAISHVVTIHNLALEKLGPDKTKNIPSFQFPSHAAVSQTTATGTSISSSSGSNVIDEAVGFDPKKEKSYAIVAAQNAIRDRLKSPSTADFPLSGVDVYYRGNRTFVVTGVVDAQNSFGAKLRTHWSVNLKKRNSADDFDYEIIEVKL